MNCIGSKQSLLGFLEKSILRVTGGKYNKFCDLFAGTGVVGRHFKSMGYQVIANDNEYYCYVLNKHYIGNSKKEGLFRQLRLSCGMNAEERGYLPAFADIDEQELPSVVLQYLNHLDGVEGFLYNNYAPTGSQKSGIQRNYLTDANAKKCDAIRQTIESWRWCLSDGEYYYLLACLLEAVDKVANTASVYAAFLKRFKQTAEKPLVLVPLPIIPVDMSHQVCREDSNELIKRITTDILYLDPPYNHRQYSSNYHLLNTVGLYDNPGIHGKTGLRDDMGRSDYCLRTKVKSAFADLIKHAKCKYIFVSYNNEGLMSIADIKSILSTRGEYGCLAKRYRRFKADKDINRNTGRKTTVEYLHWVEVQR